jgi:hypothetical protein
MADCNNKKTEIRFVGQRLASKLNSFSSMTIVTDIIKCERFTTRNSEVTIRLNKNAIEFVALPTLERTGTNRNEPNRNLFFCWNSGRRIPIRFNSCCCLLNLQMFLPCFILVYIEIMPMRSLILVSCSMCYVFPSDRYVDCLSLTCATNKGKMLKLCY